MSLNPVGQNVQSINPTSTRISHQGYTTTMKVHQVAHSVFETLVATFALAITLPFIVLYAMTKNIINLFSGKSQLQYAVDKMKSEEELARWDTLQALTQVVKLTPEKDLTPKLQYEQVLKNKLKRTLCEERKMSPEQAEKALETVDLNDNKSIDAKLGVGIRKPDLQELNIEEAARELNKKTTDLICFLQTNPIDLREANQQVTKLLREALATSGYQALKEDPNDPTIKALHRIAIALWNDVEALDAYAELGGKLLENSQYDFDSEKVAGADFVAQMQNTHKSASNHLYDDHTIAGKFDYAIDHPTQALQSMASEGGVAGRMARFFGHDKYDSHLLVSNNPSLLGRTTAQIGNHKVTINNCYGGSPTVGADISPEFHAALQAIQNNHYASIPDSDIPFYIFYTNLQNFAHGEENIRSTAIMELNKQYPSVFYGMTLSKDSSFYRNRHRTQWTSPEAFGIEIKQYLMNGTAFSLIGRDSGETGDAGFYFPGSPKDWEPIFDAIIEKANKRFVQTPEVLKVNAQQTELRGAYTEYVYSMIQGYMELFLAKKLIAKGVNNPKITVIIACKENIDRGGMANALYQYLRLSDKLVENHPDLAMKLVAGSFHARALASRNRMIHENRTPQAFAFMKYVDRRAFREDFFDLVRDFGAGSIDYEPAVKPKS